MPAGAKDDHGPWLSPLCLVPWVHEEMGRLADSLECVCKSSSDLQEILPPRIPHLFCHLSLPLVCVFTLNCEPLSCSSSSPSAV